MPGQSVTRPPFPTVTNEPRAVWSIALGLLSIVLIWPIGIALGPLALVLGISSLLRIKRSDGVLIDSGMAVGGLVMGAVVSGFYALIVDAEILSIWLTGSLIPAY